MKPKCCKHSLRIFLLAIIFLMLASRFGFSKQSKYGISLNSEAMLFADKVSEFWFSNNDSSLFYGRKGIEATKGNALPDDFGYLLFTYANALSIKGEKDSAFLYFEKARDIFLETDNSFLYNRTIMTIGSLYRERGSYDTAIQLPFFSISLVLFVGLLLLISLTLFVNMKRKKALLLIQISEDKNKKIELEKLMIDKQLNEQKLTNSLLEEYSINKQLELQVKDHEFIHQSLKHAELLQITQSIQKRLIPFHYKIAKKNDRDDFIKTLTEIASMANREVLADFDSVFASMHRNFNEKIIELAPDINPSEIQVCALLRMNLSSKEIARLNNISSASVDLMRHKIRQKLNLSQHQNLTSFLIGLD